MRSPRLLVLLILVLSTILSLQGCAPQLTLRHHEHTFGLDGGIPQDADYEAAGENLSEEVNKHLGPAEKDLKATADDPANFGLASAGIGILVGGIGGLVTNDKAGKYIAAIGGIVSGGISAVLTSRNQKHTGADFLKRVRSAETRWDSDRALAHAALSNARVAYNIAMDHLALATTPAESAKAVGQADQAREDAKKADESMGNAYKNFVGTILDLASTKWLSDLHVPPIPSRVEPLVAERKVH